MPKNLIVIKRDGKQTAPPMEQLQADRYFSNVVDNSLHANVKQSLNQAFDGLGKATAGYLFDGNPIIHASSGKEGTEKCVSIFYYVLGETIYTVAMGRHVTSSSYTLNHYGQVSGDFKEGAKITL